MKRKKESNKAGSEGVFGWIAFALSTFINWIKDGFYNLSVLLHNGRNKKNKAQKVKSMATKKRNELIFFICLVAYPVLQFCIFYVGVNINSIMLAFQKYNIDTAAYEFIGFGNLFDNFKLFFDQFQGANSDMAIAAWNSAKLYLVGLLIGLPLNLIFSFFMYKKIPGHGFFRVILFLPQIISSLVVSMMFSYFVEEGLGFLLHKNLLVEQDTAFATIIFYGIWSGFGTQILIYCGAMSGIDESVVEYGQLEGINLIQEFFYVTLPLIFPTITIFLVSGIAGLFTNQAGLFNFFGTGADKNLHTIGYVFFIKIFKSDMGANYSQYPYASAAGLLFTLIAAPITLLVKYLLEKFGPSIE